MAGWTVGLTAGLLLARNAWTVIGVLRLPPDFDIDAYPLRAMLALGEFLFKLPLLLVVLALVGWLGRYIRSGWRLSAGLAAAWLAYLGTIAALDASSSYTAARSGRFAHVKQVTDFLHDHTVGKDRPSCVYWFTDLRDVWYVGEMNCYLNAVQLSGCGFNRGTALEGRRRARRTRPFEGPALHRQPLPERWWHDALLRFLGDPADRPPTEAELLELCADEQLDFAVLEVPFKGLYAASTGRWYIYDCAWLREKMCALPAGGSQVSISAEPTRPGGDDEHRAANK